MIRAEFGDELIHEFQFRECGILDRELRRICRYFEISKSELIVKILNLNIPLMEKYHLKRREQDSRYKIIEEYQGSSGNLIPGKPGVKCRVSIHTYLPGSLYRRLKQLHSELNFYSMAQLVREVIRFFLWLFERYGRDALKVLAILANIRENYEKRKDRWRDTGEVLRQYYYNKSLTPGKITLFSLDFQVIGIKYI